jgi:predicted Holliday junction resolvase-like endonuclease
MFVYISLVLLAVSCVLLALTCRSLRRDLERDHNELWQQVARARKDFYENDRLLDEKISELKRTLASNVAELKSTMAAAEDLIKEHAELEKEAVKSEQLFQEGLQNILSYGVVKNE